MSGASPKRIARLGHDVVVVFGALEFFAPIRLRLFHVGERTFLGVAYRIGPAPEGGELWTPDALGPDDLRIVAAHIPSVRIAAPGCPTTLEVSELDLAQLDQLAVEPRRRRLRLSRRGRPAGSAAEPAENRGPRRGVAIQLGPRRPRRAG